MVEFELSAARCPENASPQRLCFSQVTHIQMTSCPLLLFSGKSAASGGHAGWTCLLASRQSRGSYICPLRSIGDCKALRALCGPVEPYMQRCALYVWVQILVKQVLEHSLLFTVRAAL